MSMLGILSLLNTAIFEQWAGGLAAVKAGDSGRLSIARKDDFTELVVRTSRLREGTMSLRRTQVGSNGGVYEPLDNPGIRASLGPTVRLRQLIVVRQALKILPVECLEVRDKHLDSPRGRFSKLSKGVA